jgi:hypothetical protein
MTAHIGRSRGLGEQERKGKGVGVGDGYLEEQAGHSEGDIW